MPPINKVSGYLKSYITETRDLAGEIQKGNFSKINVDNRRKLIVDFCIKRFKLNGQISTNAQQSIYSMAGDTDNESE